MEENYKCFKTTDESEVLELLEKWNKNGWNLNNFFIKITKGAKYFYVFYDARLDKSVR